MRQGWLTPPGFGLMAIDPSFELSGWAVRTGDMAVLSGDVPADGMADFPWERLDGCTRVVLAVERPSRAYRGSVHVVRKAGELWASAAKRRWPRKVIRINYDPMEWRLKVLGGIPAVTGHWKKEAENYCNQFLKHRVYSSDEAEAVCILRAMDADALATIMQRRLWR